MSMVLFQRWLLLRLRQFGRILKSIGIPLLLLFVLVVGGLFLGLLEKLQSSSAIEIAGFISLVPLAIHIQRKDRRALLLLHLSARQVYLAEYLAIAALLGLLFAGFFGQWRILAYALGFAVALSQLPVVAARTPDRSWWGLSAWPSLAFEWKMGWRQYYALMLPLLVLGVGLSFLTAAPITVLLVIAFIAISFFEPIEPKENILPFWSAPFFLFRKWWANWRVYLLVTAPLSIAFLVFHALYWHVLVATITGTGLLFFFCVAYKYAGYWPGRSKVYNQTAAGLFLLGFVSLFFLPVSLFFLWRYHQKAMRQLQHYHPKHHRT
jgi:hypothetical protein